MDSTTEIVKDEDKPLTGKQDRFCQEWVIDHNGYKAATRAGYSEKTATMQASRMLTKANIAKRIQFLSEKIAEKTEIDAEYVLGNIKAIGERCMKKEDVVDKFGQPTGEFQFKESGALKAQELLGRHLKLFTDRVEIKDMDIDEAKRKLIIAGIKGRKRK